MSTANILPDTNQRVEQNTAAHINKKIAETTERNVAQYADADISARINALDREWDIERTLEANAATLIVASTALGFFVNKKWFALTGVVGGFLLQHALQGWCPPVPVFRRLGIRTTSEIHTEKMALKQLRGDFQPTTNPNAAVMQARKE
ncbi:YgaP family membrane protein [Aneurinibacillus sp. REN35]|uniref:YgaP family membrane protein n=1 Tax=Aneurinibacillus sp. REN35 TaxID=3237286 RepID=UPI0035277DD8